MISTAQNKNRREVLFMVQEAITAELLNMRKRAEQTSQNINRVARNLATEQHGLAQIVRGYSARRLELLKNEIRVRGVTWCTYCLKIVPKEEVELMLVEGREQYSHGYGNAYYGFRGFSRLHRACPTCRESAYDKHGSRSSYDTQAKDQASFYAFRVEEREDGYYARRFGNWEELDSEEYKLPDPPNQVVEHLAGEWNLPPRLEINRDGKLVIHERVAVAEAV